MLLGKVEGLEFEGSVMLWQASGRRRLLAVREVCSKTHRPSNESIAPTAMTTP